jgi:hypothetical protein
MCRRPTVGDLVPFYQDEAVCIYHADCREVFAAGVLPIVDHVITDPPYSSHVDANSVRGEGHKPGGRRQDLGFDPMTPDLMSHVAAACRRSSRWSLVFSDVESGHLWRNELTSAGLEFIRSGVWVKQHPTPQMSGDRPAIGVELLTICHPKGRKRWNGGGRPAVWTCPTAYRNGDAIVHTTQKPAALMAAPLADFTDPGEAILDPFMGSGTTLVAAKRLGRKAIGIERERKYCEAAVERLRQGGLDIFGTAEASA